MAPVNPYVAPPRLAAAVHGEVVLIFRQMSEPVHVCRRSVRDDAFGGTAFPPHHRRRELKPCRAELEMIRLGCPNHAIYPVRDASHH